MRGQGPTHRRQLWRRRVLPGQQPLPHGSSRGSRREIAALEEKLLSSEEETQKLLGLLQDKDTLILHLKHRSRLLDKICRSRPVLDHLLAYMAEGEQLSPVPATQSKGSALDCDHLLETGCTCLGLDSKDFALDNDQESGKSVFGTTV
ncbi:vimentin-type intermediate filament-associated coiled-coil protein isoform X2 [Sphaerodactylus townsendi]|uniref:vimentin-type intermediate filament-associated coiled-coil protein isoform X2 n=1 Tax=Sphaerodactylus townsendi TaxID=933632 RepID=UPI002025B5EE|nr:vimentin-type intermediate filament-associated coiled-coil protein isoform X2 [Sphaerodactylus townsendi]